MIIKVGHSAFKLLFMEKLNRTRTQNYMNGESFCIMKMWKQKTWQHEITGVDGNTMLFGVNIFHYQWKATGQKVKVCDPLYNREYQFPVYTVVVNGKEHEFAAGEFSNCVWGFFLPKY